jgi:predicted helicase
MTDESINSIIKGINEHNQTIKDQVVMKELNDNGFLSDLYRIYKEKFFPGTEKEDFAVIYTHTVIFVLLSAVLFTSNKLHKKDLKKILLNITQQLSGIDSFINDILKSITTIDIPEQLSTFIFESKEKLSGPGISGLRDDEILAVLYERFLKRYEQALHKKIRYYHTPAPVVSFMVHTVHHLLKEKLNISEGLADLDMRILDPAFGTGNFLSEVIELAIDVKLKKYGEGIINPFIKSFLSKNIYGFEIMLPLYVIGYLNIIKPHGMGDLFRPAAIEKASLNESIRQVIQQNVNSHRSIERGFMKGVSKLSTFLTRLPESPHSPNLNLYLTDTLENQGPVGIVKTETPIGVIFCNPPYSSHSLNKGKWIQGLVKDYLQVKGIRIKEKNVKGLQDDYVKFFRFAQWKIDQNGSGVMGFITSNSYLDNPSFRGMRYSLLKSFDEIYILDLKGAARKVDKNDDDENVFGVGPGIAIGFFVKQKRPGNKRENLESLNCRVYYSSMEGSKTNKLNRLEKFKEGNIKAIKWERVFPGEEFYLYIPVKRVDIYQKFIKLTDIFPVHSVGIVTARDKLTIKSSEDEVYKTIEIFSEIDAAVAGKIFKLRDDTRDWKVIEAQKDIIESDIDRKKIVPILYRPFDIRYTYYTGKSRGFICMPRPEVMPNMLRNNIGLVTVRQVPGGVFSHCFVSDTIIESRITTNQKGIAYIFPLYIYLYKGKAKIRLFNYLHNEEFISSHPNIHPTIFNLLRQKAGFDPLPSPGQIFYYIYAILHSGIYREKYRDHLKIDFPRIPFCSDFDLFLKLSGIGDRLASVHLMKSPELLRTFSKYEVIGSDLVDRALFDPAQGGDGSVFINETQYFSNISRKLWEYEVCGYQVLKKWLLDRKKKLLTPGDIHHYIKICRAIQLTIQYQEQIDVLYDQLEKSI